LLTLGFYINKDAISLARKEFQNFKVNFTTKFNEKIILENLNNHKIKYFDLGIYNRFCKASSVLIYDALWSKFEK
jgi:hypothetical protein